MINAYITGKGVIKVILTPHVHALGDGQSDEYALRNSFLEQLTYYADKKTPGEVIGVINGKSAKVTLFDNGAASVYFWKNKNRLSAKWTIA
jgi:hypothetical protein